MWLPALKLDKTFTQALSSGALSYTTDYGRKTRVDSVTIKATVAITEIITITLDSAKGSDYDVILDSKELNQERGYVYKPADGLLLQAGDELRIECTAANAVGTVSGLVKSSEVLN